MVLYWIALVPLTELIREAEEAVMVPFYANNALLDGPARTNTRMMLVLMENGPDFGYYPKPEKLTHVCDRPEDVEEAKAMFTKSGLTLKYCDGH
eukprot:5005995-Ditylum_brightwellii.AAC.1